MFRYCALLSLCAGLTLAADFVTGQGARLVIGQRTFTSQEFGTRADLLGGAGGLAFFGGHLYVADSNRQGLTPLNHRVLRIDTTGFPKPLDEIPPFSGRCPVCVGEANLVLGQADFVTGTDGIAADKFQLPTGVATDGHALAVADTKNNRVLVWTSLPTQNGQPADVVLGQPDFTTIKPVVVDDKSLRAPQGVWIQNGKLYVADTQNHRVMIWNSIPSQNHQPADLVLGQPNFNIAPEPDLTLATIDAQQNTMLNPVSVTSDGTHLFVADLGHNRVLIWNSIPTQTQQPADVVLGQKDFTTTIANDVEALCEPLDENRDGEPDVDDRGTEDTSDDIVLYPGRCARTMDFPRYALSNGEKLFVADGGNDRVLVYNTIPTQNSVAPDAILGQPNEFASVVSSVTDLFNPLLRQSAADITPTPTALAWDGTNLYVADASNRRVLMFTPGEARIPINAVRNAASREIFALGSIAVRLGQELDANNVIINKEIKEGDVITVTIGDESTYTYTTFSDDTLVSIMQGIAASMNAAGGDRLVFAQYEPLLGLVKLQAREGGTAGNDIAIEISVSEDAAIVAAASGSTLQGGENATVIAPGTLVSMRGFDLAGQTVSADMSPETLPRELGKVQAYFDGIRAPLLFVSPDQVNAQVPWEVRDANNVSFYLRIERDDGSVFATTAIAVPIDIQNPGIFAADGSEPRQVFAWHASSHATDTISVDGSVEEGDLATVIIQDREYNYTVKADDTLDSIRDALVQLINSNPEEIVTATAYGRVQRIQLTSKVAGPAGDGIVFTARSSEGDNDSAFLIVSSTTGRLCCSNVKDAPVTQTNPAIPGEQIYIFATGLGPVIPEIADDLAITGTKYRGPEINDPTTAREKFVSSLAGGSTANVISAGLEPGTIGMYRVLLELSPGMVVPNSKFAVLTISMYIYTSNTVNLPVRNPAGSNVGQ